jgi:MFS family permease
VPLGAWSDRLGRRRPFVAAGLVAASAGAVALALASEPAGLILARGITGVAAAAWVAFAVLFTSYFPAHRATHAIGVINFVNIAAQAVATYGGSLLAQAYGWQASFWGAALLGVLGLATLVGVREAPLVRTAPLTLRSVVRVATAPTLLFVAGAAAINTAINFATSFGFVPVYAAELGASRADLGALTAARLIPFAAATLVTAWLAERVGTRATIVAGTLLLALANVLVPWTRDLTGLAVLQGIGGIGFGLASPVLMGLSIRAVAAEERATAMGMFQATYSIGMIVGPWGAGWLAQTAGMDSVFVAAAGLAVLSAALVAARAPRR